jgi:hypothetical protein
MPRSSASISMFRQDKCGKRRTKVTNNRVTRAWKHSNGTITRFTGSDYGTLRTAMFPPGTREIKVGGLEDVDPPPSCEHGDCFGKHTMAVAQVHVQGPWDCGGWRVGADGVMQVRQPDGEEPGWYHLWMCVGHLKDGFVDYLCNCPGANTAHEKCNCPACPQGSCNNSALGGAASNVAQ